MQDSEDERSRSGKRGRPTCRCVLGKRPKLPNCGNGLEAQEDMGSGSRKKAEIEKDATVFHLEPHEELL